MFHTASILLSKMPWLNWPSVLDGMFWPFHLTSYINLISHLHPTGFWDSPSSGPMPWAAPSSRLAPGAMLCNSAWFALISSHRHFRAFSYPDSLCLESALEANCYSIYLLLAFSFLLVKGYHLFHTQNQRTIQFLIERKNINFKYHQTPISKSVPFFFLKHLAFKVHFISMLCFLSQSFTSQYPHYTFLYA